MRRRWLLFLCCLIIPISLFTPLARAHGALTINEAETKALFGRTDLQVSLALVNPSSPTPTLIRLELLTPEGQSARKWPSLDFGPLERIQTDPGIRFPQVL